MRTFKKIVFNFEIFIASQRRPLIAIKVTDDKLRSNYVIICNCQ